MQKSYKKSFFFKIVTISANLLIVLFLMINGCDAKSGNSNISKNEDKKAIVEKQSVSYNQPIAEKTESSSKNSQILSDQDKSGIKVTFVELGSVNCIPCKMMQPIMKEIEQEYKNQVKVVFHDVWTEDGRTYGMKYKIRVIPTQVFLDKKGNEYFRHEGFFPKEQLVEVLKKQGVN
jgi:thioredoxin 1